MCLRNPPTAHARPCISVRKSMCEDQAGVGVNGEQQMTALLPLSNLERERHDLALAAFQDMRMQNSAKMYKVLKVYLNAICNWFTVCL